MQKVILNFIFSKIISFLYLRNFCDALLKKYSYFFAWIGKFSLELYIAQYHIWLANDAQGMCAKDNFWARMS